MELSIISVLIAFLSLVVAFFALYFPILKSGKEKVYVFGDFNDISLSIGTASEEIPTYFQIGIPIFIKNIGANSLAIKKLNWRIETPEYIKSKVLREPDLDNTEGFMILKPYEQVIGVLDLEFWIEKKCYEEIGIKAFLGQIQNNRDGHRNTIKFGYKVYKKKKIKTKVISYNLKDTIQKILNISG